MWYLDEEELEDNVVPEDEEELEEDDGEDEGDLDEDSDAEQSENGNRRQNRRNNKENSKNEDGENKSDVTNGKEGDVQPKSDLDRGKVRNDLENKSNELNNNSAGQQGETAGSGNTPPSGTSSGTPPTTSGTQLNPTAGQGAATSAGSGVGTTAGGAGSGAVTTGAGTSAATTGTAATGAATTGAAATGTAGATAGAVATAAAPLALILLIIAVIILIIMIAVGILMFFVAMPGQIIGKAQNLGIKIMEAISAKLYGKQNVIHSEEIASVADYIENMGYDLKGEGFVTEDKTDAGEGEKAEGGVIRNVDDNKIVDIESAPIYYYIVSDNYCYLVKNFNTNVKDYMENTSIWEKLKDLALFIVSPIAGSSYMAANISNPDWGSGLISIYHEDEDNGEGKIGVRGEPYSAWERGSIELNAESKTLKVKRGWTNNAYTFNLDGWSGRYGMPLEFLLSIHIATQMPDLAIDMATSFDTDVEVLLHKVDGGSISAGYKLPDGTVISYDEIIEIIDSDSSWAEDAWNDVVKWFGDKTSFVDSDEYEVHILSYENYQDLFEAGLPHSESCTCCSHIPNSMASEDNENCSDDEDCICDECVAYINRIIAALKEVQDNNWNSYTPYISKVTDHWFRDVYFVMNEEEGEMGQAVVKVDEDYFYQTNERWTIYETWKEGEAIPEGFQVGDYKLYEEGSDTPSTKTKAEIQEINEKIALGDTSLTRLVKKAVTEVLEANYGNDWSAYTFEDNDDTDWIQLSFDVEGEGIPAVLESFEGQIFYKEKRPDDIKQVEDGQRTETNSKIKNMFLNNTYYKYDGSVTRADAIMEDRKKSESEQDEKLKAKVNINKDSLGAFSILENTHTLDADYIYRDFKELIVELNYFDKEDLSAKIETVMQWVIPECGSAGWPIRKYEKGENFYGTLINSKIDLAYMKKKDVENAELTLEELQNEVETDEPGGGTSGVATGSVAEMVTKGYEIHKTMEDNGYDYCVLRPGNGCNHQYGHGCGLNESIAEAQAGHHNTCCATYVSWVLNEMGFGFVSDGAKATYDWCKNNGWTAITDYSSLQPGDLLFNGGDGSIGHVQMLGNNGEWLNAGSISAINDPPKVYDADFIIGMRSTLNGAAAEFEGYDPEQAVVAPVTGKIVEYGSVERDNIETGEKETVDFIKIQVLDHYITSYEGDYVTETGCLTSDTEFKPENSCDSAKEGYDYFYEEYKGVIDGCVLYIEGFDLTLEETLGNSDFSSEDVTRYEPNKVYNMTDDLKEAQALWREDAKTEATPYFKDGEDIYIKEGTVIGKTYEDKEFAEGAKGNGNYIRLILRDLEDSIMENVETYFDIPQSYSFNGSVGNIQNIESADPELMSLIEQLAGPLEGQYPGIVNILKAISMNESSGGTNPAAGDDPMQAVESTGGAAGDSIGGWENSVRAAINALTSAWDKARGYGINDVRVVIQAYNFGSGFVDYTHNKGVNAYSKSLVEQFSDEQAAKHGWSRYGSKDYVDPKIYNYLPDLNV